jgi:hypothetical protein
MRSQFENYLDETNENTAEERHGRPRDTRRGDAAVPRRFRPERAPSRCRASRRRSGQRRVVAAGLSEPHQLPWNRRRRGDHDPDGASRQRPEGRGHDRDTGHQQNRRQIQEPDGRPLRSTRSATRTKSYSPLSSRPQPKRRISIGNSRSRTPRPTPARPPR